MLKERIQLGEMERLRGIIEDLEGELREAHAMVSAAHTDSESSGVRTEAAGADKAVETPRAAFVSHRVPTRRTSIEIQALESEVSYHLILI